MKEETTNISSTKKKSGRTQAPARSEENREKQMFALAENLAEKKLRDGTASSQLICHYLRLGSTQAKLEQEDKKAEIELKKTKIKSIEAEAKSEETYAKAIEALKKYQGGGSMTDDEFYDE